MSTIEGKWESLKIDSDYEICTEYPYTIRRKDNHFEPSESYNVNGYIQVNLNRDCYGKHVVIATQWIDNDDPEHKTQVDHRNKHRDDNRIENLRWVTRSKNNLNKSVHKGVVYEYFDDIPEESMVVDFYETRNGYHEFDEGRYYYYYDEESDEDVFYGKVDDDLYRKLHINILKNGTRYVNCRDIDNKQVAVCINRFKRQHDLI